MNNIVGTYLMFKVNNICDCINILAEDMRKVSKIPRQLNKLIYKYYDLVVLSDKEINYDLLRTKTGLNEDGTRLVLFYLLIEFDMASKTEYKNNEYLEFYNFLVNSIIIFSKLENSKLTNKKNSYDDVISKILKENFEDVSDEYILLLDRVHDELSKKYSISLKKEIKFNEMYNSQVYMVNYTKVKRSSEFYFEKLKYKNDKFLTESKKDVLLVGSEFDLQINLVNIEMTLMRVLKDTLSGVKRTIFIRLDDEVISKKSNLEVFVGMIKLRFLKERIVFLVNTSLLEKYEERVSNLILDDFNVSYYKNSNLTSYDVYKNGGYLVVDYDDMENGINFSREHNLEIIVNKVNKKDIDKLNNIKYVM